MTHRRADGLTPWEKRAPSPAGFTLIDVIVGVSLLVILLLSLLGILRASLALSLLGKTNASATAIAETQIEYLRSLSYDNLGTVGGIPAGDVPQTATTTTDGVDYVVHTFISYVDDAADGEGAADENGITTDYKRARVSVSYTIAGQEHAATLVSNFAPPGMETSNGGGTLAVDVVDAIGSPVSNATVHITNPSTDPTVDLTTYSNTNGRVYLPGAATSSDYRVTVSKSGYSTAQTYERNATNANPTPGYLTVAKDETTTQTFAIDQMATIHIAAFSPVATSTFSDPFADSSKLATMSSTTVSSGALTLGSGEVSGSARSVATTSSLLVSWGQLDATLDTPADTTALLHIYDGSGTIIPDAALPGNSTGFDTFPVELSSISTTTYPSLSIGADFSTSGANMPSVDTWSLSYAAGPTPLPGAAFTLTGTKTIGSQSDYTPIYKNTVSASTGSDGTQQFLLEWDSYALTIPGYDIVDSCPVPPYALAPASTVDATLTLDTKTTNNLRILVADNLGAAVPGASVTVSRLSYSETVTASSCGVAYVSGLSAADYNIEIAKSGYTTTNFTGVPVSGATIFGASFP